VRRVEVVGPKRRVTEELAENGSAATDEGIERKGRNVRMIACTI
jgi:hypothetical protein